MFERARTIIIAVSVIAASLGAVVFASTSDGTINSTYKYAWSENLGWINFGTSQGNVHVTPTALSGYAWSENAGWISLNCSNTSTCATVDYKVANDRFGSLSGYAWSENAGWINFAPLSGYRVIIDSNGDFSGWAWGENFGWISFNCTNTSSCATVTYFVNTDYRPASQGTGGSGPLNPPSSPAPSATPAPSESPTSTPVPTSVPSPVPTFSPQPVPSPSAEPAPPPQTSPPSGPPPAVQPPSPPVPGAGSPVQPPPAVVEVLQNVGQAVTNALQNAINQLPSVPAALITVQPIKIPPAVQQGAAKIIEKIPGRETAVEAASIVGTTATVASTTANISLLFKSLFDFLDYFSYVGILFFEAIAFKRRSKPWGTVYDSVTKKPIAYAKIQLLDQNFRVLETRIADANGRYGFLIAQDAFSGTTLAVRLQANKHGYSFPSSRVSPPTDTILYANVYAGGLAQVLRDGTANFDLPMDPEHLVLPVPQKPPSARLNAAGVLFADGGFWVALVVLPLQYLAMPHLLNFATLLFFLLFLALRLFGFKTKRFGIVRDPSTRHAMPFSLITLNDPAGKRVNFTVSDESGRYFLLAPKGEYDLVCHTSAGILPPRSSSSRIATRHGWISRELLL